jgi:arabinoxylan arabinofuranohydrolase
MKIRLLRFILIIFLIPQICSAQNPIISQRYTADPVGLEYNGRLYLYTSHDIDGQDRYWMNDITCVSTDDMQNWTDHGEVFKAPDDIPWVTQAWAPTVVERNDTFYMFTGDGNRSISVAIATSPTGPFAGVGGKPLITRDLPNSNVEWCFDPTVFIDEDGQAYCVFGGGPAKPNANGVRPKNARIIKLGDDLVSIDGEAITIDAPGFYEGGFLHKKTSNGVSKYYFSYFNNSGPVMNIDYMMSDNPLTGWDYKGTILGQPDDNFNNSHASIFQFKEKWYMAYHTRKIATDRGVNAIRQRSVCVDELFYNEDGTIKPVLPTRTGAKQIKALNPYTRNEAETMSAQSYLLPGIETEKCNDIDGGRMVTEINNGDWIKISGVDFQNGASKFIARVSSSTNGGNIEIRLDNEDGLLIGTCPVKPTGNWDKWNSQECEINGESGVHNLFLKFTGGEGFLFNFNWWQFASAEE